MTSSIMNAAVAAMSSTRLRLQPLNMKSINSDMGDCVRSAHGL